MYKTSKTQRNKLPKNKEDQAKLWSLFDSEVCNENNKQIECIYSNSGEREICEQCNSHLALTEERYLACTNTSCGLIYKDTLDSSPEWRFYGADDTASGDPTRCGMPINPLLEESSYGCRVLCKGSTSYEMRKIRRYAEWQSMPYKEKSQYEEFRIITDMANIAGIPKLIVDDAMRYHKKISEARTFRGLNRDGIIAASIYVSCRINGYPRTAKEIAVMFNLDNTSATKGCKNAVSIINDIEHEFEDNNKTLLTQTTPDSFIERYCSRLSMNTELTKLCRFIALRIQKNQLIPENTPHSIAAGIIYFVSQMCSLNISKHDVNRITQISEVTINKCFKKLESLKHDLLPTKIVEKYNIKM